MCCTGGGWLGGRRTFAHPSQLCRRDICTCSQRCPRNPSRRGFQTIPCHLLTAGHLPALQDRLYKPPVLRRSPSSKSAKNVATWLHRTKQLGNPKLSLTQVKPERRNCSCAGKMTRHIRAACNPNSSHATIIYPRAQASALLALWVSCFRNERQILLLIEI